jgi:rare lipoprotein A (peptidoglycan hydrolase)
MVRDDRGPFVRGRGIDLTPAAFERLAPLRVGVIHVRLTPA